MIFSYFIFQGKFYEIFLFERNWEVGVGQKFKEISIKAFTLCTWSITAREMKQIFLCDVKLPLFGKIQSSFQKNSLTKTNAIIKFSLIILNS